MKNSKIIFIDGHRLVLSSITNYYAYNEFDSPSPQPRDLLKAWLYIGLTGNKGINLKYKEGSKRDQALKQLDEAFEYYENNKKI
jgi:hypothetical protein